MAKINSIQTVALAVAFSVLALPAFAQYNPFGPNTNSSLNPNVITLQPYQSPMPVQRPAPPPFVPLYPNGAGGYQSPGIPQSYGVPSIQVMPPQTGMFGHY